MLVLHNLHRYVDSSGSRRQLVECWAPAIAFFCREASVTFLSRHICQQYLELFSVLIFVFLFLCLTNLPVVDVFSDTFSWYSKYFTCIYHRCLRISFRITFRYLFISFSNTHSQYLNYSNSRRILCQLGARYKTRVIVQHVQLESLQVKALANYTRT